MNWSPWPPSSHSQSHPHLCIPYPYPDPGMGERLVESQTEPGHPYPGQIAEGFGKAFLGHCLPFWPEDGVEDLAALVGWVLGLSTITHLGQFRLPCKFSDIHLSVSSGEPQRGPQWPASQATPF